MPWQFAQQDGGCGRERYVYNVSWQLAAAIRAIFRLLSPRRNTSASIQVLACFRTRTCSLRSLGLARRRMSPASGSHSLGACGEGGLVWAPQVCSSSGMHTCRILIDNQGRSQRGNDIPAAAGILTPVLSPSLWLARFVCLSTHARQHLDLNQVPGVYRQFETVLPPPVRTRTSPPIRSQEVLCFPGLSKPLLAASSAAQVHYGILLPGNLVA